MHRGSLGEWSDEKSDRYLSQTGALTLQTLCSTMAYVRPFLQYPSIGRDWWGVRRARLGRQRMHEGASGEDGEACSL